MEVCGPTCLNCGFYIDFTKGKFVHSWENEFYHKTCFMIKNIPELKTRCELCQREIFCKNIKTSSCKIIIYCVNCFNKLNVK